MKNYRQKKNDRTNCEIDEYQQEKTPSQPRSLLRIRWMVRRDIKGMTAVESDCFTHPWKDDDFVQCFNRRNCVGLVAEYKGEIVGFMIYELSRRRIELLHLAVHSKERRCQIGTKLVRRLISKLSEEGRSRIMFPVNERNLPAQLFFRHLGFKAISVLRHHCETGDDAYVMQYYLPPRWSPNAVPARFKVIQEPGKGR